MNDRQEWRSGESLTATPHSHSIVPGGFDV